ncbi:hypothetical protein PYCC9005_005508 [Savitreella phatthalungensis]
MSDDSHFQGWCAHQTKDNIGKLKYGSFTPKKFTEDDVEFKVSYSGICASDLHTLSGGWGELSKDKLPLVVGHEGVGKVTRVGKNVKDIKIGDIVGVGAQSGSCLECPNCTEGHENYCDKGQVGTYNSTYRDGSGNSTGSYATYMRVPAHFAIPIPDGLDLTVAAPLMCGGVTTFSPVQRGLGWTPEKGINRALFPHLKEGEKPRVGVIGIGGLGHFGLLWAKVMGAEVVAISHTHSKEEAARKLGASHFIASSDKSEMKKARRTIDVLVCTINEGLDAATLTSFLSLLRVGQTLWLVGAPEKPLELPAFPLLMSGVGISGSAIGDTTQLRTALKLAAEHKDFNAMVQVVDASDTNQACLDLQAGKARFRYVLDFTKEVKA